MTFNVTLHPSGHSYEVPDGVTVLTAGLEAGWIMPYSCRAGGCRTCQGRILEGKVDFGRAHAAYLSEAQRAEGYALLCQAKPLSDLVIEVNELSLKQVKPRKIPCRVREIHKAAPDVAIVELKLPINENLRFAAGQYLDFLLENGVRRSYSIATPPAAAGLIALELHLRHTPGGVFTDPVFEGEIQPGQILQFEAPLGTFHLREESDKPIVFVASGTGFAPIKAIIGYIIRRKIMRPMTLYWGGRQRRDLYMDELARGWESEWPGFKYVPVLSEATPQDAWQGRTGFVHRAVMLDYPDLSGHQVYVCGAPVMVESARKDFTAQCSLPESEFFADSFLTQAELSNAAT